jgi:predicted nuclease of predicted toxin-antitoxin system
LSSLNFMALKLLIDENIRSEVFSFLIDAGYDVKKLPAGVSDAEVAKCASKESRIIITHDLDFSNIFIYPPQDYSGIVVVRIAPPLASALKTALATLANLFNTLKPGEFDKRLIILEPGGFRLRDTGE